MSKISHAAYEQAVQKYEAATNKLLGLELQALSMENDIEVKRNALIDTPAFDGLTNETKRKAYLSDGLKELTDKQKEVTVEIKKAKAALDIAAKWESFFRHTHDSSSE